jgi:hypothetical protein
MAAKYAVVTFFYQNTKSRIVDIAIDYAEKYMYTTAKCFSAWLVLFTALDNNKNANLETIITIFKKPPVSKKLVLKANCYNELTFHITKALVSLRRYFPKLAS